MKNKTEQELVDIYRRTNSEIAFEELYIRNYERYVSIADRILKDWNRSQDVVQTIVAEVLEKKNKVQNILAFMCVSIKNLSLDIIRSNNLKISHKHRVFEYLSKRNRLDHDALSSFIESALALVPDSDAFLLRKKYLSSLTFKELGKILGISSGTAASRVKMARNRLSIVLEKRDMNFNE